MVQLGEVKRLAPEAVGLPSKEERALRFPYRQLHLVAVTKTSITLAGAKRSNESQRSLTHVTDGTPTSGRTPQPNFADHRVFGVKSR